jgi:hypothetical protein
MTFLRRSGRFLLSLIAIALTAVALAGVGVSQAIGSADRAAATVGAVISTESGATALGAAFVDMLEETGGSDVVLTADKETLAKAAGTAITAQRETIMAAVRTAYEANLTGQAATIDLSPVISAIAVELNKVDSAIPADLGSGGDGPGTINIAANPKPPLAPASQVLSFAWVALALAALLLTGVAFLAPHRGWRRWRASGIMLAVVGLVWLAASKSVATAAAKLVKDATALSIAQQVGPTLVAPLATVGLSALLLGAVLTGMSWRKTSSNGATHTAA